MSHVWIVSLVILTFATIPSIIVGVESSSCVTAISTFEVSIPFMNFTVVSLDSTTAFEISTSVIGFGILRHSASFRTFAIHVFFVYVEKASHILLGFCFGYCHILSWFRGHPI